VEQGIQWEDMVSLVAGKSVKNGEEEVCRVLVPIGITLGAASAVVQLLRKESMLRGPYCEHEVSS